MALTVGYNCHITIEILSVISELILTHSHDCVCSVVLFTGGLMAFPAGFNSDVVRQFCGSTSTTYWAGDCSVGWTCILAVVSDCLAVFCPFLARHIHTYK